MRDFIRQCSKPLVIDADAITAVSSDHALLEGSVGVLTPHAGEFKTLTGIELPNDYEERIPFVSETAGKLGMTILLKGRIDVISDGVSTKLNRTGNPAMTVGGTGDVLAGETVALLSRGLTPYNAARIAAFTNGSAGDMALDQYSQGLTATDIIENIPEVLKKNLKKII